MTLWADLLLGHSHHGIGIIMIRILLIMSDMVDFKKLADGINTWERERVLHILQWITLVGWLENGIERGEAS